MLGAVFHQTLCIKIFLCFVVSVSEKTVCARLLPLVWSTDCDPKQKTFMNTMLADREKYPYQVPISDCPHNIKLVRSAELLTVIS